MDRETFILTRDQIRTRMEDMRQGISRNPPLRISGGLLTVAPFLFSFLKNLLVNNKKTFTRIILTTVGFRILTLVITRSLWGLFSKRRPSIL